MPKSVRCGSLTKRGCKDVLNGLSTIVDQLPYKGFIIVNDCIGENF